MWSYWVNNLHLKHNSWKFLPNSKRTKEKTISKLKIKEKWYFSWKNRNNKNLWLSNSKNWPSNNLDRIFVKKMKK